MVEVQSEAAEKTEAREVENLIELKNQESLWTWKCCNHGRELHCEKLKEQDAALHKIATAEVKIAHRTNRYVHLLCVHGDNHSSKGVYNVRSNTALKTMQKMQAMHTWLFHQGDPNQFSRE